MGSLGRSLALAATVFLLAAATFADDRIAAATFVLRYVAALALVTVTWQQGRYVHKPTNGMPTHARILMSGTWLMAGLAFMSTYWSVDAGETLAQAAVFTLLVLVMHVHVTRRWHAPGTVEHDVRVIFWTLAVTVVVSLGAGTVVGVRLGGLYANPNSLGLVAAFTASLGLGLCMQRWSPWVIGTVLLSLLTILGTESRTGLIGFALACTWVFLRRLRAVAPAAIAGLLFAASVPVAALLMGLQIPTPAVFARFQSEDDLFTGRQAGWEYALQLWQDQPLTGYGFRVGEVIFSRDRYLTSFTADGAHNSYLQTLLELGCLGLIPLALMLLALIGVILRADLAGVHAGLAAVCITGLALGFTESALFGVGQPISWVFWLSAAALSVAHRGQADVGNISMGEAESGSMSQGRKSGV
jgi:O-antigen ligase